MAMILDGKAVSEKVLERIKESAAFIGRFLYLAIRSEENVISGADFV